MILGQLRPQFTSILCQWENVCYLLAFSSCFCPKLNSFFITNTESTFQIYLVVLEQGHSPQTAEDCTVGFSCCIVAEPWLCSIRCCSPSHHSSELNYIICTSGDLYLFPDSVCCSHMCFGERDVGFFPFFLSKPPLSRSLLVFLHDENSLSSTELPAFLFAFHLSFLGELRFKHWGCSCPASEQEWLGKNLFPGQRKIHLLLDPDSGKLIHLRIN